MNKIKYNDVPFVPSSDCPHYEDCIADAYQCGREDAIEEFCNEIDLEKPMHFTKEQVAWIKKYVILKRQETIDEALQIFHNVYTQNLYCMEDECESKEMDCDGCLYITFQKHLKSLKGGEEE